jgi:hypothetical protein
MTVKNIFQNTAQSAAKVTEETTGGNSFAIPTSGGYEATLQLCYMRQNAKKPSNTDLFFVFKLSNGFLWNYPVYSVLVNGSPMSPDKDGKPKLNYGFSTATRLMTTFTGKSLEEAGGNMVSKIVELYNFELSKNVPTTVEVFADSINTKGYIGLTRKIENKKALVDGDWVALPERKEVAVLSTSANQKGQTFTEIGTNAEPVKFNEWVKANTGKDWNAYTPVAGAANQSAGTGSAATPASTVINFG